jgi:hypothetical protein
MDEIKMMDTKGKLYLVSTQEYPVSDLVTLHLCRKYIKSRDKFSGEAYLRNTREWTIIED